MRISTESTHILTEQSLWKPSRCVYH